MELHDGGTGETRAEDESELVFHYKRGSFRQHEQNIYSDLATGKTAPKKGLFKVLFATKGNRATFFAMAMCAALVFAVSILNGGKDRNSIAGLNGTLSAFSFDGSVYAALSFSLSKKSPDMPVPLKISFECRNTDGAVAERSEFLFVFNPSSPEAARAVFSDYDLVSVTCRAEAEGESRTFECKILNK